MIVHLQEPLPGDAVVRPYLLILALLCVVPTRVAAQSKPRATSKAKPTRKPSSPGKPAPPASEPTLQTEPPSTDSLAAIARRGRTLALYDEVAWLASGAMTSLSFPVVGIRKLIAVRTEDGWQVANGALSETGSEFLISELATPGMQKTWASFVYDPPRADSGIFARAARAIETALVMFRPVAQRAHIATAVPAQDGPWWWVYVYPAPVQAGEWPRGGDMRFKVSADGRVITETRRLHDSITEYSVRSPRPATPVERPPDSGDAPEDTDVFHILQRRPALPELMTAGRYRYRIDVDGSIRLIGIR